MDRDAGLDLSKLAHDLRGPLMPLQTAAWLMRNEAGESARICELADIVERQCSRLARMLEELADWGRSGTAQAATERAPIDLALALDMAIGAIPGCTLQPRYPDQPDPLQVRADPHQFAQLLNTLIRHAIQRSGEAASPDIDVSAGDNTLRIRVRDRGLPLDETGCNALLSQPQPRPFDEGLGLRLLIARRIAQACGGEIHTEIPRDGGLALVCALPIAGAST